MKKLLINLVLVAGMVILSYYLIDSIRIPIVFEKTLDAREQAVRDRLQEIGELQKIYKSLNDEKYAPSFDSLAYSLMNDTFEVERLVGDANDTTVVVQRSLVHIPAKDSLQKFIAKSKTLPNVTDLATYFNEIQYVPYSAGDGTAKGTEKFTLESQEIAVGSGSMGGDPVYTSTFEVRTTYKTYMPEFDESYTKFNPKFVPDNVRKIGDLSRPITTGNW